MSTKKQHSNNNKRGMLCFAFSVLSNFDFSSLCEAKKIVQSVMRKFREWKIETTVARRWEEKCKTEQPIQHGRRRDNKQMVYAKQTTNDDANCQINVDFVLLTMIVFIYIFLCVVAPQSQLRSFHVHRKSLKNTKLSFASDSCVRFFMVLAKAKRWQYVVLFPILWHGKSMSFAAK